MNLLSLWDLGLSSSCCSGSLELQFLYPQLDEESSTIFSPLKVTLSSCQETTNVSSSGCFSNVSMPSYRYFFKSGFSSYLQQEFWSATICSIIARSKIYIFHKHWKRQFFYHEMTDHYYRRNEQLGRIQK